jgi:hypothetical protein
MLVFVSVMAAVVTLFILLYRVYIKYEISQLLAGDSIVLFAPKGGTGNQLFQYAAAFSFAKKHNLKLYATYKEVNKRNFTPQSRYYVLDLFGLKFDKVLSSRFLKQVPRDKIIAVDDSNYFTVELSKHKIYLINGWFESPIFYENNRKEILSSLSLSFEQTDGALLSQIKDTKNSCFLHIRRGDFNKLTLPTHYTLRAMEKMRDLVEGVRFFVFSDDPQWVCNLFKDVKDVTVVSDGERSSLTELYLMTQCTHGIVANSTFSYWAAELKQTDGHILAPWPRHREIFYTHHPEKFNGPQRKYFTENPYPQKWHRIEWHEDKEESIDP